MDRTYLPILLLMGFVVANAILIVALSHLTIRRRVTPEKNTPYESGIPPLGDARERFSIKFYMVAILFVVFDVEAIFFYPWGAVFTELGWYGYGAMLVFTIPLAVGLLYEYMKGGLEW